MSFTTFDGKQIVPDFMTKAFEEAINMIYSFKCAYHMFFAKTENVYDMASNKQFDELHQMVLKEQEESLPKLKKQQIPLIKTSS